MNDELIYLFTGNEEVLNKDRMNRLIDSYDAEKTSIIRYDLDVTPIIDVINDALTIPFLADQKIIIVKNPRFLANEKSPIEHNLKYLSKYLKNPAETTIFIIDATGYNLANNDILRLLKQKAYIINHDRLEDIELKARVKVEFAKNGVEIRDDALNMLFDYVGNDLIVIENEINKLSIYAGKGGVITLNEIKLLVSQNLDSDVFTLIKAIINKDRPLIITKYAEMTTTMQDSLGLINLLGRTFRELLTTLKLLSNGYNQNSVAKFYEVTPGRAYYMVRDAKMFKIESLEKYVIAMADLEYKIKSGQIDKSLGLEMLLLEI